MRTYLPTFGILLLCASFTQAQSVELLTGQLELIPVPEFAATNVEDHAGRSYYFLQFDENPSTAQKQRMQTLGVALLQPLRQKAWVASVPSGLNINQLQVFGLAYLQQPTIQEKLHPVLSAEAMHESWLNNTAEATILLYDDVDIDALLASGEFAKANRTASGQRSLIIRTKGKQLIKLASHPAVQWVEPPSAPGEPEDERGRGFHRVHQLGMTHSGLPGLDGTGVTVVVNDDGFVGPHIDFTGRTEQGSVAGDLVGDHGDMVGGIVCGAGNLDPTVRGMAPGAFMHVRQYDSSLPNTVTLHQNDGAMIFNSSYSNGCNDGYTALTQQVDQEIIANPALLQVFSAGNAGTSDCGYGAGSGWGNITGGHKAAKNVITTANMTDDGGLENSSSRGPAEDGRIKPDISAYGAGQMSTDPDNTYAPGGGTSAASPGIVGTMAVLYEGWRSLNGGNDPKSGLLKAIMMNTAEDLGNEGPDYSFGWGRVHATRAWRAIQDGRYLTAMVDQGGTNMHSITVPSGTKEVKMMVYWMDPAASPSAATALVNDLNMQAIEPGGVIHQPWILETTPSAALLSAPATTGVDDLNNVEQVARQDPAAGTWTVTVNGFDVPVGPQEYFVVYEFISPDVEMVYPIGEECLPPGTHRVRWDAAVDGVGFDISLSLDGGASWNPAGSAPSGQLYLDITLPNNVTAQARVRVEQGTSVDESGDFSIMGTPINLQVTANCYDSATISWNAVTGADAYVVYMLGTMYMDSIGTTNSTSYTFLNLQPLGEEWFSVSAVNNGGACSQRANAVQRPVNLLNCPLSVDLFSNRVISPPGSYPVCQPQNLDVRYTIVNNGSTTINSLDAAYSINGATPVSQVISAPLIPGDSVEVLFAGANLSLGFGTNELKVWGVASGEQYPINDTITHYISSQGSLETLPFFEDMESLAICDDDDDCDVPCLLNASAFYNEPNAQVDALDWRIDQGGTPSNNTGPEVDHTLGNTVGKYAYVESSIGCFNLRSELISPCLDMPAAPIEFSFWHHMFGSAMGDLHVDIFANGSWDLDVAPVLSGEQGNSWQQAFVPMTAYEGELINFRFRSEGGINFTSDMAIDDISISSTVGVEEQQASGFTVVPNAEGSFLVTFSQPFAVTSDLQVLDAMGRSILKRNGNGSSSMKVDLSEQATGVYLFQVNDGNTSRTKRISHY